MQKTLKNHASLRGTNVVSDAAIQLSWFPIRAEEWQGCTFSLLPRLTEFKRGQSASVMTLTCKRYAFTMAEILLSLTIIGVVAAITLPSLMANINERTWNTQRKALYARISQAIGVLPNLSGYGTYNLDTDGSTLEDTAAETFLTEGLSKVLKINNICDNEHLADCGIATSITAQGGSVLASFPKTLVEFNSAFSKTFMQNSSVVGSVNVNTKAAAFETLSGESVAVFYNPNCVSFNEGDTSSTWIYLPHMEMCANFVYDLNGNKGPNTMGKDIGFITALYPVDCSIVAPIPLDADVSGGSSQINAGASCKAMDENSRVPNVEELAAIFYNGALLNFTWEDQGYWSGNVINSVNGWHMNMRSGARYANARNDVTGLRCIKRY